MTSTARDLTTGKIEVKDARALVEAFLSANSAGTFTSGDDFVLDTVVIDQTAKTIEATASAHVDIAFPLFSNAKPSVAITSAAVYSDKTIEVAMMLDITGSMAGQEDQEPEDGRQQCRQHVPFRPGPKAAARARRDRALCASVNTGPLQNMVFVEKPSSRPVEPPALYRPRVAVS